MKDGIPGVVIHYILLERFVGVNQFLQHYFYNGLPRVVSFRVSFYPDIDSSNDIDQWASSAVSIGVQWPEQIFSCTQFFFLFYLEERGLPMNLYTLSSEPFSRMRVSKLQHLIFARVLGQVVINQFNCLISLSLVDVCLGPLGAESIFSCCLKLQSVTLATCDLPRELLISGSRSHGQPIL